MQQTIQELKFKGNWRSYQQRVLDELNFHLADDKLNIVAAPGAGKTTLGIEVLTRLKHPVLILTPTITIKNQWKQRIIDNFLAEAPEKNFISDDIEQIGTITISTYQNIHSLYKIPERKAKLIKDLKSNGIQTLILDEAHHLRTEWYATLIDICKKLKNEIFRVVSLTGTPPYDVSPSEWQNYNSLCGPVDAEISIPELVKAGDLCPHQDLVYFSDLTEEEQKIVDDFEARRNEFFKYINEDSELLYSVKSSPFVNDLENNVEIIYENTNFTISLISYLLSVDNLNIEARILTEFLELELINIPQFDYQIAETLFEGITGEFKDYFKNSVLIKNRLRRLHLTKGKTVDLTGKVDFKNLFARSKNKLNAIKNITEFEYKYLEEELREVILLDFIGIGDSDGLNIVSVFDELYPTRIKLGILTGNLIVIPETEKENLYKILEEKNIPKEKVLTAEFKPFYLRVEAYGIVDIVSVITELFERGSLNVLIGTAALLGEGWDSPCVNTLIIASIVGSFMLSNQMRGRALRINKKNPQKTSNIWHLVSLGYKSTDIDTIKKRFNTFEGISYDKTKKIQNGLKRLNLDKSLTCEELNKQCFDYAKRRNTLPQMWEQVFQKSEITEQKLAPMVYDVIESTQTQSSIIVSDKIPQWCKFMETLIDKNSIYTSSKKKSNNLFLKLCRFYGLIKNDYEKTLERNRQIFLEEAILETIARCLLDTLYLIGVIKTDYENLELKINKELDTNFYITLIGCTNYERHIFIQVFEDMFKISDNRYILKQASRYLAVPDIIGKNGKNVKLFVQHLEKELGMFEIIFTKSQKGYRELLKAKYNTFEVPKVKNSRTWI